MSREFAPQLQLTDPEKKVLSDLKSKLSTLLSDKLISLRLFGSKARNTSEPTSDLDVALVVEGLSRQLRRQILDIVADLELEHLQPISLFVLSSTEYQRLTDRERRIALDIEKEGIPL